MSSPLRTDLSRVSQPLNQVARLYRDAAGSAFAAGDDEKAKAYREGADRLSKLIEELPELPPVLLHPNRGNPDVR